MKFIISLILIGGIQLNSILNRISKYTPNASIIGLSATVGNPEFNCRVD